MSLEKPKNCAGAPFVRGVVLSLVAGVAAVAASAQSNQAIYVGPEVRRGMFSASPLGVVVKDHTVAGALAHGILVRGLGVNAAPPTEWSVGRFGPTKLDFPDYSLAAIFGNKASIVRLAGMSTGNDVMPTYDQNTGEIQFAQSTPWLALTVSVNNAASGAAQGPNHPKRLVGQGDSPGSELFTYYFFGSDGIANDLINTLTAEQSRENIGLTSTAPSLNRPDVTALDYGLGTISHDRGGRETVLFKQRRWFYFTLDPSCVASLPNFATHNGTPINADASTIYECEWIAGMNGGFQWSTPRVYRSSEQLGIAPTGHIDAIAVDRANHREIFSLESELIAEQLYVYEQGRPMSKPLKSNGQLVGERIGLQNGDNIDSACSVDPEAETLYSQLLGYPVHQYGVAANLGISVVRSEDPGIPVEPVQPDRIYIAATGANSSLTSYMSFYVTDLAAGNSPAPPGGAHPWGLLHTATLAPYQDTCQFVWNAAGLPVPEAAGFVALSWRIHPLYGFQFLGSTFVSRIKW